MAARSASSVTAGLPRKIHPPNLLPKATVCAAIRATSRTSRNSLYRANPLFLLSIRIMGYRGEECSGGRTVLEPTAKNYSLREELAQNRGILRSPCGRFEQSDTGESCGVEMAEREELGSNLLRFAKACIREQSQWLRLPKAKKGRLQRAAIATAPFKSPSASEMPSNPFGLYAPCFRLRLQTA